MPWYLPKPDVTPKSSTESSETDISEYRANPEGILIYLNFSRTQNNKIRARLQNNFSQP